MDSSLTHRSLLDSLRCLLLMATMCCLAAWLLLLSSCSGEHEHTAPAINERDSVSLMTTYGVNTLISDSGVIKYRIVAERWEINEVKNPSRWIFEKGVLLTQFDQTMHIQSYIQCDTAYYYDKERRWELHGRVRILTKQGVSFSSEELFWDENRHELWSYRYSHLKTPERELQGNYFRSDENMTRYEVTNTRGAFDRSDFGGNKPNPKDSMRRAQKATPDSVGNRQAVSRDSLAKGTGVANGSRDGQPGGKVRVREQVKSKTGKPVSAKARRKAFERKQNQRKK